MWFAIECCTLFNKQIHFPKLLRSMTIFKAKLCSSIFLILYRLKYHKGIKCKYGKCYMQYVKLIYPSIATKMYIGFKNKQKKRKYIRIRHCNLYSNIINQRADRNMNWNNTIIVTIL